jgi:hypothetical protein
LNNSSSLRPTALRLWLAGMSNRHRMMRFRWSRRIVPSRYSYIVRDLHLPDMPAVACGGLAIRGSVLGMPTIARGLLPVRRSVMGCFCLRCGMFFSLLTARDTHQRKAADQNKKRSHVFA